MQFGALSVFVWKRRCRRNQSNEWEGQAAVRYKVGDKKVENKKREKWKNKIIIIIPLKQKEREMEEKMK